MTLRLYMPHVSPVMRELGEMERLSNALFNPANWGRDIISRETATACSPIKQTEDGNWKMELYVDVHKFKPEEVTITTKDGRMTVEASSDQTKEDGSFHSHRHIKRVLAIPDGVRKEDITAKFTEEGGVLLEAPAQPPKPKALKGPTNLPITHH